MPLEHHPFRKLKNLADSDATTLIDEYIDGLVDDVNCKSGRGYVVKCSCLHDLLTATPEWKDKITPFLLAHYKKNRDEKNSYLVFTAAASEAHQQGRKLSRPLYPVPATGLPTDAANGPAPLICRHAFFTLMGCGRTARDGVLSQAKASTPKKHALCGRKSNHAISLATRESLKAFFDEWSKHAVPTATRFVRMETDLLETRDNEDDKLELPSCWSKLRLYGAWLQTVGKQYRLRNAKGFYDILDLEGYEGDDIKHCAYSTFLAYWEAEYPHIVLPKPREDICNDCFRFSNMFRYQQRNLANAAANADEDDEEQEGGPAPGVAGDNTPPTTGSPTTDNTVVDEDVLDREDLILKAGLHVKRAKAQRDYYNSIQEGLEVNDQDDAIVVDYCQNLQYPHLAAEQPGKTYYLSPLVAFCFGVVDLREERLQAFTYKESDGAKGANNVASLIYKHLVDSKKINPFASWNESQTPEKRNKLTIFMDNCSGQNKNNTVLRLPLYLVEKGFYKEVECVFFVVGHTKNPCDRCFNLLKEEYRKENIWTFEQLIDVMNKNKHVEAVPVNSNDFDNWGEYLDELYDKITSGCVKPYHIFSVSESDGAEMVLKIKSSAWPDDPLPVKSQEMRSTDTTDRDRAVLFDSYPQPLEAPGLKLIKKVEMGKKWRPLVPIEFRASPEFKVPSKEEMGKHKDNTKKKKKRKMEDLLEDQKENKAPAVSSSTKSKATASSTRQPLQESGPL